MSNINVAIDEVKSKFKTVFGIDVHPKLIVQTMCS